MKIHNLHSEVEPEKGDYFYVADDGDRTLLIRLTSGNYRPFTFRHVSRAMIYRLISALQSTMLAQDAALLSERMTDKYQHGTTQPNNPESKREDSQDGRALDISGGSVVKEATEPGRGREGPAIVEEQRQLLADLLKQVEESAAL